MGVDKGYKPANNKPTKDKGLYGDKKRLKASRIYARKSVGYGEKYFNESTGKMTVYKQLPKNMQLLTALPKGYKKSPDYQPSDVAVKIGKTAYGVPYKHEPFLNKTTGVWGNPLNAPITAYNTGKKTAPKKASPKKPDSSRRGVR